MNYEEMSDFEINSKVALHLGKSVSSERECIDTGSCFILTSEAFVRIEFNPCSNPSDAWPIIVENGICLTSPTIGRKHQLWSASWNEDGGRWSCGDITHGDKNPLRAAMICFLKMKDAENE